MSFLSRLRILGTSPSGQKKEVYVGNNGVLPVEIEQRTAFNEVNTSETTWEIQTTFPYGVHNTDIITQTNQNGSGSLDFNGVSDRAMSLSTGTTTASRLYAKTKRKVKYRSGQGVVCKFAGLFNHTTGGSDSFSYVGIGDTSNGYFFAIDDTNSTEFTIVHVNNGTYTYYDQSTWNVDTMDGGNDDANPSGQNLDITKGNVYKIEFQYLGFGAINFFIEDKNTGKFQLVHQIKYTNTNTLTSLANPTLGGFFAVDNGSGTNDQSVKITSFAMGVQGKVSTENGLTNSYEVLNKNSTLLNGHLMTIRSRANYGGVENLIKATLTQISIINESTSTEFIELIENGTFTGVSYSDINTNNSTVEVDVAGTYTIGTGKVLTAWGVPKSGASPVNQIIKELGYFIQDNSSLSLVTKQNSNDISGVLTWSEDF